MCGYVILVGIGGTDWSLGIDNYGFKSCQALARGFSLELYGLGSLFRMWKFDLI